MPVIGLILLASANHFTQEKGGVFDAIIVDQSPPGMKANIYPTCFWICQQKLSKVREAQNFWRMTENGISVGGNLQLTIYAIALCFASGNQKLFVRISHNRWNGSRITNTKNAACWKNLTKCTKHKIHPEHRCIPLATYSRLRWQQMLIFVWWVHTGWEFGHSDVVRTSRCTGNVMCITATGPE